MGAARTPHAGKALKAPPQQAEGRTRLFAGGEPAAPAFVPGTRQGPAAAAGAAGWCAMSHPLPTPQSGGGHRPAPVLRGYFGFRDSLE